MEKRYSLLLAAFSAVSLFAHAQELAPGGGGGYTPPRGECLTPAQSQRIDSMIQRNVALLRQQGILAPAGQQRPAAVPLGWPLRQAPGFDYNSYYGISNFVDRNPGFPNQVLDWNCGNRTYDTNGGYNHAGIDVFLWPFDFNMMDAGQVDIVAAAPGIIVGRYDGNFDRNCLISNANWNAVYVQSADGTVCWYGHMKSGSLTGKGIGASVAQGEYLGKVGSSGSSTGPHLHFEVHDAANRIVDPYAGPCNNNATWWSAQKPYFEPTLNTIMTHSAAPSLAGCPSAHNTNQRTAFMPNDLVFFASYFHDQLAGLPASYTVYRPDNSVFQNWTGTMNTPAHYAASYWWWSHRLPVNAPTGTWRFAVTYQGNTVTRTFTVGTTSSAARAVQKASLTLYPNPAQQQLTVETLATARSARRLLIHNSLGQLVATYQLTGAKTTLPLTLRPGVYVVSAPGAEGTATRQLTVY